MAKHAYTSVKVSYTYCHNANMAFFDGLSLFREEFGQTYTYDEDGNVISVVDAQKAATEFEYSNANDMTGVVDAQGNSFNYVYDSKHNVTKGTSAQGIVYKLSYDTVGNVTKSGTVEPSDETKGIWLQRAMTTDNNHVASVTDAQGNKVEYTWNAKDQLTALKDGKGNSISYGYDTANRLNSVSQQVTIDGTEKTVTNTYGFTNDRLTSITHNGFQYAFAYDAFGNTTAASIAGTQAAGYTYDANNGNLLKTLYGNGDYIRYTYDAQDRVIASYVKKASDTAETLFNKYVYDKQGNLSKVTNYPSGKTYQMSYDFLNRLMGVLDEQGNAYDYKYDELNHMTRMRHTRGAGAATTRYTYDKDGRELTTKAPSTKAGDFTRTTEYDSLGRVTAQTWDTETPSAVYVDYAMKDSTTHKSLPSAMRWGSKSIGYTYDANGNITGIEISDLTSGNTSKSYVYDELNQLIRENDQAQNKTFAYIYDEGGNLRTVREYAYTTGTLPATPTATLTGTYDTVWKDKLLNWNGTAMTYDAIGNMLTKGSTTFSWQGRKLMGVNNGKSIQYLYDHTGATVVEYTYDSWGKVLSITGSKAATLGVKNPFRYRGYYYDNETGLYYLKNRYYDPELRRFISADRVFTVQASMQTLHNRNLYSYCNSNPIVRVDDKGDMWAVALASFAIGTIVSVGCQLVIDKKEFSEVNWISAVSAGLGLSMSLMGASGIAQTVVGVAGDFLSNYSEGKTVKQSIINTAINYGVGEAVGKFIKFTDLNYLDYTRYYKGTVLKEIRDRNYNPIAAIPHFVDAAGSYHTTMNQITRDNIKNYIKSESTSRVVDFVVRRQIG